MPAVRKNIFHIFSPSINSKFSIMDRGHLQSQETGTKLANYRFSAPNLFLQIKMRQNGIFEWNGLFYEHQIELSSQRMLKIYHVEKCNNLYSSISHEEKNVTAYPSSYSCNCLFNTATRPLISWFSYPFAYTVYTEIARDTTNV